MISTSTAQSSRRYAAPVSARNPKLGAAFFFPMTNAGTSSETFWEKERVAQELHKSVSWVEKAAARGVIPSKKLGNKRLYVPDQIRRLVIDGGES